MKRSEALELIRKIQVISAHARGMIKDGMTGYGGEMSEGDRRAVELINPMLFPKDESIDGFGLPQVTTKMLEKGEYLEPIDLFNLLILLRREDVLTVLLQNRGVEVPPAGIQPWLMGWEAED